MFRKAFSHSLLGSKTHVLVCCFSFFFFAFFLSPVSLIFISLSLSLYCKLGNLGTTFWKHLFLFFILYTNLFFFYTFFPFYLLSLFSFFVISLKVKKYSIEKGIENIAYFIAHLSVKISILMILTEPHFFKPLLLVHLVENLSR